MKILITTPTGQVGRRIIPELLSPEFSVRVITENPAALPEEIREQVEVVVGSAAEPATMLAALDDIESVYFCIPTAPMAEKDVQGHYERFARVLSGAVQQAGTPRLVTISTVGRDLAQNAGAISGLHGMEEILNQSGAAIRHLRCGLFMESLLPQAPLILERGVFCFPIPGDVPLPMVAAHDVADVALRWLVRQDWNGIENPMVPGPERISCNQAAAVFEAVLERPVQYREAPANQYIQSLAVVGASVEYAQGMVQMFAELAKVDADSPVRLARPGISTSLAAWAEKELASSLPAASRAA